MSKDDNKGKQTQTFEERVQNGELLSLSKAGEYLGVEPETLTRAFDRGHITGMYKREIPGFGYSVWYVERSAVEDYKKTLSTEMKSGPKPAWMPRKWVGAYTKEQVEEINVLLRANGFEPLMTEREYNKLSKERRSKE